MMVEVVFVSCIALLEVRSSQQYNRDVVRAELLWRGRVAALQGSVRPPGNSAAGTLAMWSGRGPECTGPHINDRLE